MVKTIYNGTIIDLFNTKQKVQLLDYAINAVSSTEQIITAKETNLKGGTIWLNKHIIALHEKFALAIACIILFFVGVSLISIFSNSFSTCKFIREDGDDWDDGVAFVVWELVWEPVSSTNPSVLFNVFMLKICNQENVLVAKN